MHAVCVQARETKAKKNPGIANTGITNLKARRKMPVEGIRRVKHLRMASKLSRKKKSVPVLNATSVAAEMQKED